MAVSKKKQPKKGAKSTKKSKKLPLRIRRFIDYYLVDLNGTKAAKLAGYSESGAHTEAYNLLKNPEVIAEIVRKREEESQRLSITRERIAQEYARIAFFDARKVYDDEGKIKPPTEWDADMGAVVAGMEVEEHYTFDKDFNIVKSVTRKIKKNPKNAALDSLVKMFGFAAPEKVAAVTPTGEEATPPVFNITIVPPNQE